MNCSHCGWPVQNFFKPGSRSDYETIRIMLKRAGISFSMNPPHIPGAKFTILITATKVAMAFDSDGNLMKAVP